MAYKLPMNGIRYDERSEAYTSKVGAKLSKPLGPDVHKTSAYAFAIKVTDYPSFARTAARPVTSGIRGVTSPLGCLPGREMEEQESRETSRHWHHHRDSIGCPVRGLPLHFLGIQFHSDILSSSHSANPRRSGRLNHSAEKRKERTSTLPSMSLPFVSALMLFG